MWHSNSEIHARFALFLFLFLLFLNLWHSIFMSCEREVTVCPDFWPSIMVARACVAHVSHLFILVSFFFCLFPFWLLPRKWFIRFGCCCGCCHCQNWLIALTTTPSKHTKMYAKEFRFLSILFPLVFNFFFFAALSLPTELLFFHSIFTFYARSKLKFKLCHCCECAAYTIFMRSLAPTICTLFLYIFIYRFVLNRCDKLTETRMMCAEETRKKNQRVVCGVSFGLCVYLLARFMKMCASFLLFFSLVALRTFDRAIHSQAFIESGLSSSSSSWSSLFCAHHSYNSSFKSTHSTHAFASTSSEWLIHVIDEIWASAWNEANTHSFTKIPRCINSWLQFTNHFQNNLI